MSSSLLPLLDGDRLSGLAAARGGACRLRIPPQSVPASVLERYLACQFLTGDLGRPAPASTGRRSETGH